MRGHIGVTDGDWYSFHAAQSEIDEVNFWTPSGRALRALQVGEPFLFKTHVGDRPSDRIVGGGFFRGFVLLRMTEAWRFFGPGNGAHDGAHRKSPVLLSELPHLRVIPT